MNGKTDKEKDARIVQLEGVIELLIGTFNSIQSELDGTHDDAEKLENILQILRSAKDLNSESKTEAAKNLIKARAGISEQTLALAPWRMKAVVGVLKKAGIPSSSAVNIAPDILLSLMVGGRSNR